MNHIALTQIKVDMDGIIWIRHLAGVVYCSEAACNGMGRPMKVSPARPVFPKPGRAEAQRQDYPLRSCPKTATVPVAGTQCKRRSDAHTAVDRLCPPAALQVPPADTRDREEVGCLAEAVRDIAHENATLA